MAKIVPQSKFRNIYGQTFRKQDCYEGVTVSSNMFENNYSCVNPRFLAVATKPIGCFTVLSTNEAGRISNFINIKHSGSQLMDLKWNPYNDRMLATCSDDGTIKIWVIPEEGLTDVNLQPVRVISSHKKRVYCLEWHPSAENILATASADHTAAVLNIAASSDADVVVCKTEPHDDFVSQVCWDYEGERLFTFGKEQLLRSFDARTGKLIQKASNPAHPKKRAIKIVALGSSNLILSTGFNSMNAPELKLWEMEDLDKCVNTHPCGEGSGCLFPYFDNDTNVIYVAARGEVTVRYFELVHNEGEGYKLFDLFIFNSQTSQKALCQMPKRGLDYMECEIARLYKLLNSTAMVEPVSFFVPRRAEGFQDDLFPDTVGVEPAMTAEEWIGGKKSGPLLVDIQTIPKVASKDVPDMPAGGSGEPPQLQRQLSDLQSALTSKDEEIERLHEELEALRAENAELKAKLGEE